MNSELKNAFDHLLKGGGEGSRGGKVVGHTKSGKPRYEQGAGGAHLVHNLSEDQANRLDANAIESDF